ncbi:Delta-1-pyrroline-5-carboxylate dehydrogenase 1, partial [Metarhizium majus ARSEF 297]
MGDKQGSTLCFIGCGNLGTAILSGLLSTSKEGSEGTCQFSQFIVSVRTEASVTRLQEQFCQHQDKLRIYQNQNERAVDESDVIILATDPADVTSVLTAQGMHDKLAGKLLISIAAGWTRLKLENMLHDKRISDHVWIIRTLPNVAAMVHQGLTVIETPHPKMPTSYLALTKAIFDRVGKTIVLPPSQLDAATAVGGSTPAFFAIICEALIDASVAVGVPRDVAHASIAQAMLGTAHMLQTGMQPAAVKDMGTSPEGCTMSGLMVLEETAVRGHVGRALREAVTVARLMGSDPEYRRGSAERAQVERELARLRASLPVRSDIFYNGQAQAAQDYEMQVLPAENKMVFTNFPLASKEQVNKAIDSALLAKREWQEMPFVDRTAVFLKAAELVSGKYRYELIAATMLGQGKNVWQAEIDAAAELADFFRLNCNYAAELLARQPTRGTDGVWTRVDHRPLEGFVYAVSPFNFTALGGALISGPALMGNVVVWKPSPYCIYPSTIIYKILLEAGLPTDVIQMVPGDAEQVTSTVLDHQDFAGINFIGSSHVFRSIYAKIGQGIGSKKYREFPRIVGETSGKNFQLVHSSGDIPSAVNHAIRGAFEYQGQKCSATSRVYVPESRAQEFIARLKAGVEKMTIGSPDKDFEAFMGPVIHKQSFNKIKNIIDESNKDPALELITGGKCNDSQGYYIAPTVYKAQSPDHELFNKEIFGPVLVIHVYTDAKWGETLQSVDRNGGGFALTGAVFAKDRKIIRQVEDSLRYSAGNFYINCKTTAALIGQQTFGGARSSGTNDKAGSSDILRRFTSPRTIKEEFSPLGAFTYPSNESGACSRAVA